MKSLKPSRAIEAWLAVTCVLLMSNDSETQDVERSWALFALMEHGSTLGALAFSWPKHDASSLCGPASRDRKSVV